MNKLNRFGWLIAALLVGFGSSGYAAGNARGVEISGVWVRATAPGQDAASVDMTITSKRPASLLGASSPASKAVQLHSMTMEGGMMRMRQVKAIELPAGKQVNLLKSGYHLMLIGLKAPLKKGEMVPLTLSIKVGRHRVIKIRSMAEVTSLTASGYAPRDDGHQHMPM